MFWFLMLVCLTKFCLNIPYLTFFDVTDLAWHHLSSNSENLDGLSSNAEYWPIQSIGSCLMPPMFDHRRETWFTAVALFFWFFFDVVYVNWRDLMYYYRTRRLTTYDAFVTPRGASSMRENSLMLAYFLAYASCVELERRLVLFDS